MTYSIRLPDEIEARLQRLSDQTGRTKKFYVMKAIELQLDDLEDIYLAEERLLAQRAGKTEAIPLEELMQRYGLED